MRARTAVTAAVVAGACVVGLGALVQGHRQGWRPELPQGTVLITNERAVSGDSAGARRSPDWIVTSGSLFADDGGGWTGAPDGASPDAGSTDGTGSAVFRMVSQPTFGDARVMLRLRLDRLVTTDRTPARDYDGMHVFVRYRDPDHLYAVSVSRRDGLVAVKKKDLDAASRGEVDAEGYQTLATADAPFLPSRSAWVVVAAVDTPSGVRITLEVDGRALLDVVDTGSPASPPLVGPGRIGLRGDNAEMHFWDLAVEPA